MGVTVCVRVCEICCTPNIIVANWKWLWSQRLLKGKTSEDGEKKVQLRKDKAQQARIIFGWSNMAYLEHFSALWCTGWTIIHVSVRDALWGWKWVASISAGWTWGEVITVITQVLRRSCRLLQLNQALWPTWMTNGQVRALEMDAGSLSYTKVYMHIQDYTIIYMWYFATYMYI